MTRRSWWIVLLAVLLAPGVASAQKDEPGSKDHPAVPRMPGYFISAYDAKDFGAYDFQLKDGEKKVEGRYWQISYEMPEGKKAAGPLQISRNYGNAVAQKGGVRLFEEVGNSGGRMTARLPTGGGKHTWIEVSISNHGEVYELSIVEEAALEQVVEIDASELAKTLAEKGSAAIYGILFDTGKATNRKLSADRAAAVKSYLVQKHSVAADRLTTAGFADDKPVADNANDAGRAKNRRVELVRK